MARNRAEKQNLLNWSEGKAQSGCYERSHIDPEMVRQFLVVLIFNPLSPAANKEGRAVSPCRGQRIELEAAAENCDLRRVGQGKGGRGFQAEAHRAIEAVAAFQPQANASFR